MDRFTIDLDGEQFHESILRVLAAKRDIVLRHTLDWHERIRLSIFKISKAFAYEQPHLITNFCHNHTPSDGDPAAPLFYQALCVS